MGLSSFFLEDYTTAVFIQKCSALALRKTGSDNGIIRLKRRLDWRELLALGIELSVIAEATDLSVEEIQKLKPLQ